MAVRFPLAVVISAVDAASPSLKRVEGRIGKFAAGLQTVGRGLSMTVTPAVAALGAFTFKVAAGFEQSLLQIKAASGATATDLARLRKEAKTFTDIGLSAGDSAAGMLSFSKAGLDVSDTLKIMRPAALLAASANMEVGAVSDDLVNIMSGYKIAFADAGETVDTLTWATDKTTNNLDDLTQALRLGGPVAAAMNQDFKQTVAVLGLMGQAGFKATLGGTALRGFLSDVTRIGVTGGSSAQRAALKRMGLNPKSFTDSNGKLLSMVEILRKLEGAGAGAGELMMLFGERAGPGIIGLLNQGIDKIVELEAEMGDQGLGSTARKTAIVMSGPEGALRKLSSEFKNLQVAIGESGFLQFATDAIKKVTGWVMWLQQASPETLKFGTTLVLMGAALGPVLYVFGTLGGVATKVIGGIVGSGFLKWLGMLATTLWTTVIPACWSFTVALLANPITWVVVAVVALIAGVVALVYWWDEVSYALKVAWNWIVTIGQSFYRLVFYLFPALKDALPDWLVDLVAGDTLKFDLTKTDKTIAEDAAAAGDVRNQSESKVAVDFTNLPRGTTVDVEKAAGGFELNTGYAMAGY